MLNCNKTKTAIKNIAGFRIRVNVSVYLLVRLSHYTVEELSDYVVVAPLSFVRMLFEGSAQRIALLRQAVYLAYVGAGFYLFVKLLYVVGCLGLEGFPSLQRVVHCSAFGTALFAKLRIDVSGLFYQYLLFDE